ncbi:MAG: 1-acyl-sn-glycerol-3-phosphate acyltransferase [Clostridiales bacterium]|nr:1-acyl-sn-glycerol-3-phosphate acyltransferase [Clostridiales bacterium]
MNTKKYMSFFGELAEKGELPRDIYDIVMKEIAADGKMTKRVYNIYLTELEKRRLFDVDGAPFDTKKSARTDGTFVYKHPKNPFWHIAHAIWNTIFKLIGYFGGAVVFGVWRVKDRKKLKKLGAYITTANHVGYLDGVLTLRATGMKSRYIVVAPHNCKSTVGGRILKSAGVIPLPISIKGARPFNDMLEYVKERKATIHFYPEKSMWIGYKKPRPYKDGAFYYAEKLDIPVVPMLYCFKKPTGLRKLFHLPKAVIKIADPIYVDKTLKPFERKGDVARRAYAAATEMYEKFYGIPLEYESAEAERETIETSEQINHENNQQKDER